MIVFADILPDGLRVVALQRGGEELVERRTGNLQPEPLGRFNVRIFES
jgi:hypothetical protein